MHFLVSLVQYTEYVCFEIFEKIDSAAVPVIQDSPLHQLFETQYW